MIRLVLAFLLALASLPSLAQGTMQQVGPVVQRHLPSVVQNGMYGDSGYASGFGPNNGVGTGISEQLLINPSAPSGPFGTNWCDYDNPVTNPAGYHYFCEGIGANGAALIAIGAGGVASPASFSINLNGTIYPFPGPGTGNVIGPVSPPVAGDLALWNGGLSLKDGGPPATINPALFGAKGDCVTDDAAALTAANAAAYIIASNYKYAATNGGNTVIINLGGRCYALGSNVIIGGAQPTFPGPTNGPNGVALVNGKVVPAGAFAGTLITIQGGYNTLDHVYCDGHKVADCFNASSGVFELHVLNSNWVHFPNFGLKAALSGAVIDGNLGTQWLSSDAEFTDPAQYTARALWILGTDGHVDNNIMHNALYPLACGDDVSVTCGNSQLVGNHFYNGTDNANPGSGLTNPIAVHIGIGSSGLKFTNTYIDNGYIDLFTNSIAFDGMLFSQNGLNTIDHWIKLTATSASETLQNFVFGGSLSFGGGGSTSMFLMSATGGNSWNTNTAFLNALQPGQMFISNGAVTNFVSGSGTFAEHFQGGASNTVCIGLAGGFATPVESSICQAAADNLQFNVNGFTTLIDPTGSFQFNAPTSPLTCASGCGTVSLPAGAPVGSNGFGHVTLGATPSNTVVINFSPAWASSPTCLVQERSAISDLTSFSITANQLTINLSAATAGRALAWWCASNG